MKSIIPKKTYIPFCAVNLHDRQWPKRCIEKPPIWCSVDLRDGNQALVNPMNLNEKLDMFRLLVDIGIKEIEVGFPSASQTEYDILRALIDGGHIPDDVKIQVLVQARPHLIRKTFEAINGAKNVIFHFYNSISPLQRKVVFDTDEEGVSRIAVDAARMIRDMAVPYREKGMNIAFEYSPESFSNTEPAVAVAICNQVMEAIGSTSEDKLILNLPATVECSTANGFADQVEYFCRHLERRDSAIISVHPHNDRGTAVAAAELALLAGAERIEGTLFGNGERTGNVDLVTLALNMYTQGIDPGLDFHDINAVVRQYERATKMHIHERHPYAGELVFTAFSGSHQDAINKGFYHINHSKTPYWEVPYLPINPGDIGREYEPIIRINSQSGKGGAAYVMQQEFGYILPKAMHPEFGALVKAACDRQGTELSKQDLFNVFDQEYIHVEGPYAIVRHRFTDESHNEISAVHFDGTISVSGHEQTVSGEGNGPIDAFFNALSTIGIVGYEFVSYHEHAISAGSDSKAIAYIELKTHSKQNIFGVGISHNINLASLRGVVCAINRAVKHAADKNEESK